MRHFKVLTKQTPAPAATPAFLCFFLSVGAALLSKGDAGTYRSIMEDKGCRDL